MRTVGTIEMCKLTGASKQYLKNKFDSGDIPAEIDTNGYRRYPLSSLLLPEVQKIMAKKRVKIPDIIMREISGIPKQIPTPAQQSITATPPPVVPELPVTSLSDLNNIPAGLLIHPIDPLPNMTSCARDIWMALLPGLISMQNFYREDVFIFQNYCNIQSQIFEMELQLQNNFIDPFGKINPIVANLDKARNTAKAYAISLNISPLGRKNFSVPETVDENTEAWNNLLNNKKVLKFR